LSANGFSTLLQHPAGRIRLRRQVFEFVINLFKFKSFVNFIFDEFADGLFWIMRMSLQSRLWRI
jgi:hypothetical protein